MLLITGRGLAPAQGPVPAPGAGGTGPAPGTGPVPGTGPAASLAGLCAVPTKKPFSIFLPCSYTLWTVSDPYSIDTDPDPAF